MKIAAVTDDGLSISPHFGRADTYLIVSVSDDCIVDRALRAKASHHDFQHDGSHSRHHHDHGSDRGYGKHAAEKHHRMFEPILDCQIVLARGMGMGAYQGLLQNGIRPILTDIADIETAVLAVIDGSIEDLQERLH